jgi:hypothetical protein
MNKEILNLPSVPPKPARNWTAYWVTKEFNYYRIVKGVTGKVPEQNFDIVTVQAISRTANGIIVEYDLASNIIKSTLLPYTPGLLLSDNQFLITNTALSNLLSVSLPSRRPINFLYVRIGCGDSISANFPQNLTLWVDVANRRDAYRSGGTGGGGATPARIPAP